MKILSVSTGFYIFVWSFTIALSFTLDPVIVEKPNNPDQDAETLYKSMKGWGTKDSVLIATLTLRTDKQRQAIYVAYTKKYNRDLRNDIKHDTSGHYQDFLVDLTYPLPTFLADEIYVAINRKHSWAYLEILLTAEGDQLTAIKDAYQKEYTDTLLQYIQKYLEASAPTKSLLNIILNGTDSRSASTNVDSDLVKKQMTLIPHEDGKCTPEANGEFFTFLATSSFDQIGAVVKAFDDKNTGDDNLYHKLKTYCKDEDLRAAYSVITQYAGYRAKYFAMILNDAMKGVGTKESYINRILIWRSEIDLNLVKKEYLDLYHRTLEKDIKDDTSFHYEDVLVKFLGGNVGQ